MTTIFQVVRETCDRDDCRLKTSYENVASGTTLWYCETCNRGWDVSQLPKSTVFDRNGLVVEQPTYAPRITEIKL